MKKVLMAAMTLVMAVFASCTNEDLKVENNDVKVNFTVAEKPGFNATRALKTGWANGDKILIFLAAQNNTYAVTPEQNNNTITLSYNGSTWSETIGTLSSSITNTESAGGKYVAVHYRGEVGVGAAFNTDALLANYVGGEYMTCEGTYTKTNGVIELGELSLAYPNDAIYVSVKVSEELKSLDWKLMILDDNYTSGRVYDNDYFAADAFKDGDLFVSNIHGYIKGINNDDGSSFVKNDDELSFFFIDKDATSSKYTFYLYATNNGVYTYTTTSTVEGGKAYKLPDFERDEDEKPVTGSKWTKQK